VKGASIPKHGRRTTVRKRVPVVTVAEAEDAAALNELPMEAAVVLAEVAGAVKEGLMAFATATGLVVFEQLMAAEMEARIGPKHARLPEREGNWHGKTRGSVVLGGRRVEAERPRGRTTGGEEVALETWSVFASDDLLTQIAKERMLAGVATRRHKDVAEPVGKAVEEKSTSTSKSAISRRFKRATEAELAKLMSRDLSDIDVAVVMIDGIEVAGSCCVAALVITADGTKVPVGLWLGDTENKTVVTALLSDLVERGLKADAGLLVVIDGAKALDTAVKKVFGKFALIQRCQLHKRRNVRGHLPKELGLATDRRIAQAFSHPDPARGLDQAKAIANSIESDHPDAAASMREGLEQMFTLARLGIDGRLRRSLSSTNAIESMISVARTTTARVKRWEDGKMRKRWVAAGMLEAEKNFRRIMGYKQMPKLVAALRRHAERVRREEGYDQAA
jgi:transposase-like protein